MEQLCIFEALLAPADSYEVPTPEQVKDESYAVLNAASDTTGNAMTVAAYNTVINPEIYGKLTAELKAAFPNSDEKIEYSKLEKLPYLVTEASYLLSSISNV
jgi:cytochrome P450